MLKVLGVAFLVLLCLVSVRFMVGSGQTRQVNLAVSRERLVLPAVDRLEVLPLVESESERSDLRTEGGLSYLVSTPESSVLLDLGYNKKREEPSPLLHNARRLGVDLSSPDAVVISHPHADHAGGIDIMKGRAAWSTRNHADLGIAARFGPAPIMIDGKAAELLTNPRLIAPGVGSTGALYGQTFYMGRIPETSLLVNVRGKGLVVITGCGHPGIVNIARSAQRLTGLPLYAVVGGFHLFYGRCNGGLAPSIFGARRFLGLPETRRSVTAELKALKGLGAKVAFISPHDSNDQTIRLFQEILGVEARKVMAGSRIEFTGN